MNFDYGLLEALSAVGKERSFEKAAAALRLTPSAVSQRIKLLETRMGAILVVRGKPCELTEVGNTVVRHLENVRLLEREVMGELPGGAVKRGNEIVALRIAVNADSIATWFPLVMAGMSPDLGVRLDLIQDDQEISAERLREGHVMAAVTADSRPVQGFKSVPLGTLEYAAIASPEFVEKFFADGIDPASLGRAPSIAFNQKDTLLNQWMNLAYEKELSSNSHWVPSYEGYIQCCINGVGWGLHPIISVRPFLSAGTLVELHPDVRIRVPLYWQFSRTSGQVMRDLTELVESVAKEWLPAESD